MRGERLPVHPLFDRSLDLQYTYRLLAPALPSVCYYLSYWRPVSGDNMTRK